MGALLAPEYPALEPGENHSQENAHDEGDEPRVLADQAVCAVHAEDSTRSPPGASTCGRERHGLDSSPVGKKKYIITFPPSLIREPLASTLVKDYDLVVNILRAHIRPDEEGVLVVELDGSGSSIEEGIAYARSIGAKVEPLAAEVRWHEDRCTHCTYCVSACPAGALSADRETMLVSFDGEKCIACELCVSLCPYGAMEAHF